MSVFFKNIQPGNPVKAGDVESLLEPLGLGVRPEEAAEYQLLLAAAHDCAERINKLPDYQPVPDEERFPRRDIRVPGESEQHFGHAWAHRFIIEGNQSSTSAITGKTVCVKDCIAVAKVPQFFGSDAFPAWTPSTDAMVVTRVLEDGATVVGSATCENFCNSTSSFTSAQGIVHNPHQTGYSAGGSTSGGAALVAGGVVDMAIGTDQGGSIRVPASLCGCVGFKPTHGLVPYTGITSGDQIDDHAGPLANSVDDVAACLDAIAGYDGIDDRSLGAAQHGSFGFQNSLKGRRLEGIRIGVLREGYDNDLVQAGVKKVFFEAVARLKALGATVEEVSIPLHNEGPSIWTIQQRISGSAGILGQANGRRGLYLTEFEHARLPWTANNFEKLFPSTKNTVINGLYLQKQFPGLYAKTMNVGRQIRDAYEAELEKYDVIIMPTTPFVAPKNGTRESVLKSFEPSIGLTSNTAIFNVTGHPALSLPVGWSAAAGDESVLLPVGLQMSIDIDTKEKPFPCECGAAFGRRDLLTRHRRVNHHEDSNGALNATSTQPESAGALQSEPGDDVDSTDITAAEVNPDEGPWFEQQPQTNTSYHQPTIALNDGHHQGLLPTGQHDPVPLSPRMPDNGDLMQMGEGLPSLTPSGVDVDMHFRDFASFLDGVGLCVEWSPIFNNVERPEDFGNLGLTEGTDQPAPAEADVRARAGSPFSTWLPSAPTKDRNSSNVCDLANPRVADPEIRRFDVTEEQRVKLDQIMRSSSHILDPTFRLPSRHALTRYIKSFFGGFHLHMPFIHVPTWHLYDHPVEVIFGIAAIGAQYCFEKRAAEQLFFAGKAFVMDRLARPPETLASPSLLVMDSMTPAIDQHQTTTQNTEGESIETIRALLTLMGYATWDPQPSTVRQSFALQELLTQILRNEGLEDVKESLLPSELGQNSGHLLEQDWRSWVEKESTRRTKLVAFSFIHTHSIAYDVYPPLRSNEIGLRLPCSTLEWNAPNALSWHAARKATPKPQLFFKEALSFLLDHKHEPARLDPIPTPLGNYVLLHGLIQRIHIVRDLSLPIMSDMAALPPEEVEKLERGLRCWTSGWQQAPESSLDPNNENGPIPFTSSSLLALAYARIYLNLGPYRQLQTREPQRIARALTRCPEIERSEGVIAALLYATHMLGIPVKLGVDRVAKSQAFFWSVRHSLASLDCAILLSKWLTIVASTSATSPLTDSEERILYWVKCIVEEAYAVVDFDDTPAEDIDFQNSADLALAVLRIWAHFFKSNSQWPFINIIGHGLEAYRNTLVHAKV
ncbi:MAG: Aldo/keto reductase [Aureobasidium pullulans]|nr:MAG: Aldo/keto reductase [Aureobasidium pullulans]